MLLRSQCACVIEDGDRDDCGNDDKEIAEILQDAKRRAVVMHVLKDQKVAQLFNGDNIGEVRDIGAHPSLGPLIKGYDDEGDSQDECYTLEPTEDFIHGLSYRK